MKNQYFNHKIDNTLKKNNNLFTQKKGQPPQKNISPKETINNQVEIEIFLKNLVSFLKQRIKLNLRHLKTKINQIPTIKVALALLVAFLIIKKDFNITLNLGEAPIFSSYLEDQEDSNQINKLAIYNKLQTIDNTNPFTIKPNDQPIIKKEKKYINRFKETAITEMKKYGIPASIKMAQGLIESAHGTSTLAIKNNNHFGIKCFSKKCTKSHCSNFSDDHHKDFFRKYNSSWESWRAHSKLLNSKHYKPLKEHKTDYEAWAFGLKKLGYATDPNYPQKLIQKIKKYKLYLLDSYK